MYNAFNNMGNIVGLFIPVGFDLYKTFLCNLKFVEVLSSYIFLNGLDITDSSGDRMLPSTDKTH